MTIPTKLLLGLAFLFWDQLAVAQSNLGNLLDARAKLLSADEFKQELVQRLLVGPTASGANLEVIYTTNGMVQGTGSHTLAGVYPSAPINGEWKIDDNGRVCTSMRISVTGSSGGVVDMGGTSLPARCQFWFKYGEQYFLSDSDSDRSARVFRRTLKK